MLAMVKGYGEAAEFVSLVKDGGWASFPDGSMSSPAQAGLRHGDFEIMEIDDPDETPSGGILISSRVEMIGGVPTWVKRFDFPKQGFPTLSSRQFWLAAHDVGVSKDGLFKHIEEEYGEDKKEEAGRIILEISESSTFERDYPLVSELAEMTGISESELDALWLWAASI